MNVGVRIEWIESRRHWLAFPVLAGRVIITVAVLLSHRRETARLIDQHLLGGCRIGHAQQ